MKTVSHPSSDHSPDTKSSLDSSSLVLKEEAIAGPLNYHTVIIMSCTYLNDQKTHLIITDELWSFVTSAYKFKSEPQPYNVTIVMTISMKPTYHCLSCTLNCTWLHVLCTSTYGKWLKVTSTGFVRLLIVQLSHERLAEMMGEAIRELAWSGASNLCIGKSYTSEQG